jgi:integrase
MGTVYNRGTRSKPNWYVAFKDAHGRRRALPSHQPTKFLAKRWLETIEARIANGKVGIEEPADEPRCETLMTRWAEGLRNRNARDDRSRLHRHLRPEFGERRITEITLAMVMEWIDRQRDGGSLSDASIRHNLNLLSRFFSWAIERGHVSVNPVRQIPTGKRPKQSPKQHVPWLSDDDVVRKLLQVFPTPMEYMFYLGNRSGLRTGEIAGLRLSDLGFLAEGVIRVRYSYDGPLKEDKANEGKVKWVPAADDCQTFLGPWLARRAAAGAGPEDLVFPGPTDPRRPYNKRYIERAWDDARTELKLELTWYQATRHSFVSRLLEAGASVDEVSAAVGHSSPVVTRRYYDHFIRRRYSDKLRSGLGLEQTEQ